MAAIEVSHISKGYPLYHRRRDRVRDLLLPGRRDAGTTFWALRDVSFQVSPGSTLGVVGDNGAGKSTLLSIAAGIVRPTEGEIHVRGRVATLMELGAGFNPDFTGRENVYMGGAVMGYSKAQMDRLLPAIEAFAELGEFFDRPVKIYSSGMYVRLAFALAVTVDPDILVVDEVLAVGDQYFQKKCIDRIEEFRRAGKTMLFCSHHLYYIRQICDQALWLRDGRVEMLGPASEVAEAYQTYVRSRRAQETLRAPQGPDRAMARILSVTVTDERGGARGQFVTGETALVRVRFEVDDPGRAVHVGVHIARNDQVECLATATHFGQVTPIVEGTTGSVALRLKQLPLLSGLYEVSVALLDEHGLHLYDARHATAEFVVISTRRESGLFLPDYEWVTPDLDAE